MIDGKTILGIIPARGGSKRLPNKNILDLNGKPLVAWTVEAGLKSKYIDRLMVSTDSIEIAEISKKYGAEIPFIRSVELASDTTTTTDVVIHTINYYKTILNKSFDFIILLQPTSPLRNSLDIDSAIEFLINKAADSIISVSVCEYSPLWSNTLSDNLSMKNFINEDLLNKRSQDLPQYYRLNGAIFICNTVKFIEEKTFFLKDNLFAYILGINKSIDIDTKDDFDFAKYLLSKK